MRPGRGLALGAAIAWAATGGAAAAAGDAVKGAKHYAAKCAMCHGPAATGGMGPSLLGVVGRRAASAPFAYSAALRKAGWTWDAPHLDRYLADPAVAAPGTTMPIGVPKAEERADLIAFMTGLKPKPGGAAR